MRNEVRAVEAEVEAGRQRQRPRFARVRQGSMLAIQRLRQRPKFARVKQGSMQAIHTVEAEGRGQGVDLQQTGPERELRLQGERSVNPGSRHARNQSPRRPRVTANIFSSFQNPGPGF